MKTSLLRLAAVTLSALTLPLASPAELKTIKRIDDPVVMECSGLASLFGTPVERTALMALHRGVWSPVPFQLDQVMSDGSYAYTQGPGASVDPEPGIDADDELVFMAEDTGDRADGETGLPEWFLKAVEIEVTDPLDRGKGWVYLASCGKRAPRSDKDYIRLEVDEAAGRRRVVTDEYVLEGPMNRIYPDFLARRNPDGSVGPDILDRLKIRGEFILPFGVSIDFKMDEWTMSRDVAYIDGPVRVLHLSDGWLQLARFIKIEGEGYSDITYYVNYMIWPMYIETPMDLRSVIKKTVLHGYMDFNEGVYGSHPFNAANPYNDEVVLDGRMSEAEKEMDRQTPIDWNAGFGPAGAVVSRLVFPEEWSMVKKLPYYVDDLNANDPPDDHPGTIGVGYDLVGFEKLGKTSATYYQYYYFKSRLSPDEVDTILNIRDHPLETRTRLLQWD